VASSIRRRGHDRREVSPRLPEIRLRADRRRTAEMPGLYRTAIRSGGFAVGAPSRHAVPRPDIAAGDAVIGLRLRIHSNGFAGAQDRRPSGLP